MITADMLAIGAAALAGGAVNAIAGGGSLITFPTLVAVGLPSVTASLTNTVAMCPGYLGAAVAQRRELAGQRGRLAWLVPAGAAGGVLGALLLLWTDERAFDLVVPFLLLFAAGLLALQDRIRGWLVARNPRGHAEAIAAIPVGLAAIYGGYFGAGLGVIVLAALAVVLADSLIRINAVKQVLSLAINVAAAAVFIASGLVDWPIAGVMSAGSLIGGALGGRLASRVPAGVLRWLVVGVGVAISGIYFWQLAR